MLTLFTSLFPRGLMFWIYEVEAHAASATW